MEQPAASKAQFGGNLGTPHTGRILSFVTLGPAGTDREPVTERYLAFHDLNAAITLIDAFFEGFAMIDREEADDMVQAAVHPDCANLVAHGFFSTPAEYHVDAGARVMLNQAPKLRTIALAEMIVITVPGTKCT